MVTITIGRVVVQKNKYIDLPIFLEPGSEYYSTKNNTDKDVIFSNCHVWENRMLQEGNLPDIVLKPGQTLRKLADRPHWMCEYVIY